MKSNLLLLILFLIFQSCTVYSPPRDIKQKFTFCYDGKPTGLENYLNIKGYYKIGSIYKDSYNLNKIDTIYSNFMFYRDGTFVDFYGGHKDTNAFLKKVVSDQKEKRLFENNFYWGKYILENDIIKIQWINRPSSFSASMAWEEWYKIIDKNTLRFIKKVNLRKVNSAEAKSFNIENENRQYLDAKFYHSDIRPDSTNWLKKEKWFNCQ